MSKIIELTQGKHTIVDDEDYEELSKHKWCVISRKTSNSIRWYALTNIPIKGKSRSVLMHRYLKPGANVVDHKDNDGLNNQKLNLRACNYSGNNRNQSLRKRKNSIYRFKGVKKFFNRWVAYITHEYKSIELFGEFAKTNKMLGLLE